jgi:enolase
LKKAVGYQVLDSRGVPTVAAAITLADGTTHTARVPSGASTANMKQENCVMEIHQLPISFMKENQ